MEPRGTGSRRRRARERPHRPAHRRLSDRSICARNTGSNSSDVRSYHGFSLARTDSATDLPYLTPPGMRVSRLLGSGTFGKVFVLREMYSLRTHGRTRRVLKVSEATDTKRVTTFQREVFWGLHLLALADRKPPTSSALSPPRTAVRLPVVRMFEYAMQRLPANPSKSRTPALCRGYQVMERLDGTVTELGLSMASPFRVPRHALVHTWSQLRSILNIVEALDSLGLVHGDLKRSNLLHSADGRTIVAADFGFSGLCPGLNPTSWNVFLRASPFPAVGSEAPRTRTDVGRPSRALPVTTAPAADAAEGPDAAATTLTGELPERVRRSFWFPKLGYPAALCPRASALPLRLWRYLNRWQMYFDMTYNRITYCVGNDETESRAASSDGPDDEGSTRSGSRPGVGMLLEPAVLRRLLGLPDAIVLEFDALLQRKLLPSLPTHAPLCMTDKFMRERAQSVRWDPVPTPTRPQADDGAWSATSADTHAQDGASRGTLHAETRTHEPFTRHLT